MWRYNPNASRDAWRMVIDLFDISPEILTTIKKLAQKDPGEFNVSGLQRKKVFSYMIIELLEIYHTWE